MNTGSLNSDVYLDIRSGLNHSMVTGDVKGVFATYPNPEAKDFPGLPILVVNSNNSITSPTMSGLRMGKVNATITCYSNSTKQVNEVIDKVYRVIDGDSSLRINKKSYSYSMVSTSFIGKKSYHQKDMNLTGWNYD